MRCRKTRWLLTLREGDGTSLGLPPAAEAHLSRCAVCRQLAQEMSGLRDVLRVSDELSAPVGFAARVMARLRASRGSAAERRVARRAAVRAPAPLVRKRLALALAGLAVAVYAVGFVAGGGLPVPGTGRPTVAMMGGSPLVAMWETDSPTSVPRPSETLVLNYVSYTRTEPLAYDPGFELLSYLPQDEAGTPGNLN